MIDIDKTVPVVRLGGLASTCPINKNSVDSTSIESLTLLFVGKYFHLDWEEHMELLSFLRNHQMQQHTYLIYSEVLPLSKNGNSYDITVCSQYKQHYKYTYNVHVHVNFVNFQSHWGCYAGFCWCLYFWCVCAYVPSRLLIILSFCFSFFISLCSVVLYAHDFYIYIRILYMYMHVHVHVYSHTVEPLNADPLKSGHRVYPDGL